MDWIDEVKDAFGNGEKVMSHVLVLGGGTMMEDKIRIYGTDT